MSRLRADGVDPMALRLALLAGHYRTDREWTDDLRKQGELRLARWRAAVAAPAGPSADRLRAEVRARLGDDLDTPGALALVDDWADAVHAGSGTDPAAPAAVRDLVDARLGVRL